MKYRVLYIMPSGVITWQDVNELEDCFTISKNERQEVDVYERKHSDVYKYKMSVEVNCE